VDKEWKCRSVPNSHQKAFHVLRKNYCPHACLVVLPAFGKSTFAKIGEAMCMEWELEGLKEICAYYITHSSHTTHKNKGYYEVCNLRKSVVKE